MRIRALEPGAGGAESAMRALSSPAAPATAKAGQAEPAPSYKPGDRRELDRLIENTR